MNFDDDDSGDSDEEPRFDGNADYAVCAHCGGKDDLIYDANPFALEIHGIDTKQWLCKECRYQSAMDI